MVGTHPTSFCEFHIKWHQLERNHAMTRMLHHESDTTQENVRNGELAIVAILSVHGHQAQQLLCHSLAARQCEVQRIYDAASELCK